MKQADIFSAFEPVPVETDGTSVYDFLGVATDVRFKRGWAKHAIRPGETYSASYPPLNEHYLDWVLTLEAVSRGSGTFRMMELGAGWGTWLVRAAAAARQVSSIHEVKLLGVEADRTHFEWMLRHFEANGLRPVDHILLHGAVGASPGKIKFPRLDNPDEDYGASTRGVYGDVPFVLVDVYTVSDLVSQIGEPIDFVHVDMQGAEYDCLLPAMDLLSGTVKSIMVGTHISQDHHDSLVEGFKQAGWVQRMNYARMAESDTPYGRVKFGDGLIAFSNPKL